MILMRERATLDANQAEAVAHGEGPCLVVAGPGSGKTRVIVERFLSLVDKGVDAGQQLVLTYTRKAAQEMLERAEAAHGPFSIEPPLSNYHSYAQRVVRDWGWLIGVAPGFHIADDAERWLHLEAVLADLKPRTLWNPLRPHDLIDPLLHLIGHAKQELVTPQSYASWAAKKIEECTDPAELSLLERHRECARVYGALEERYRTRAVLDHDDCIRLAELLIREQPAARRGVAEPLHYVMVDEYQDTNFAQARLVETLVSDHHNLLVVADDDQAIYKFRGASLANLDRFSQNYPRHKRVVLDVNYRSTPQIVSAAAAVIDQAPATSRIGKDLAATRDSGDKVDVWRADDERSEMETLANQCRDLIESGRRAADIAWLFRRHIDMQAAMSALAAANVPYEVHGGRGFFTSREIKDCWALLNAIDTPDDSQAMLRCLQLPAWRVSNPGRLALARAAREHDIPLLRIVENGGVEDLDPDDAAACKRATDAIAELSARTDRDDVRDIFFDALDASEFMGILDEADLPARIQAGANLNKFGEMLENFADWSDDRRVAAALTYLDVLRNSRDADELAPVANTGSGVVLMTAHSAKGLEWPVVVVPRCVVGRWPDNANTIRRLALPVEIVPESTPGGNDIDEERRLFYVAITRARDKLILSSAAHYARSYSDERRSPFLEAAVTRTDDVELRAAPPSIAPPRRRGSPRGEPTERPRFAVMDVVAYAACPRKFDYRKRFQLPVRQTQQAWYGNLIHTVLQSVAMRRKAGAVIDTRAIQEIWHEAWETSAGEKGRWQSLRELGAEQLSRYVESPAWLDTEITDVEASFTLPLTAADVSGRFDRIDQRPDGVTTIVDYKTGPPKSAEQASRDLQVRAYGVAASQRDQTDHVAVELHYLQTAEVVRVDMKLKELDRAHRHLSASTNDMANAWTTGVFPPKPSAWLCRRCEYRTVCDEGQQAAN